MTLEGPVTLRISSVLSKLTNSWKECLHLVTDSHLCHFEAEGQRSGSSDFIKLAYKIRHNSITPSPHPTPNSRRWSNRSTPSQVNRWNDPLDCLLLQSQLITVAEFYLPLPDNLISSDVPPRTVDLSLSSKFNRTYFSMIKMHSTEYNQ